MTKIHSVPLRSTDAWLAGLKRDLEAGILVRLVLFDLRREALDRRRWPSPSTTCVFDLLEHVASR